MTREKRKVELIRNHVSDLLTQDFVLTGFYRHCDMRRWGLSFKVPYVRYEHPSGDIFWDSAQLEEIRLHSCSALEIAELINFITKLLNQYGSFLDSFEKDIEARRATLVSINEYIEHSYEIMPATAYFVIEDSLEREAREHGLSLDDVPTEPTDTTRASFAIAGLKDLSDAERIAKRYGYLGMKYFGGAPWTAEDITKMSKDSTLDKEIRKTSKTKNLSQELKHIGAILTLRTRKWELMCRGAFLFRKFVELNFIERVVYRDLLDYRVADAIAMLENPEAKKHKPISNFILECDEDGVTLTETETHTTNYNNPLKSTDLFFGMIAYKGRVVGKAKIVRMSSECHKVEAGDIMVATMSTPDFLPAMQKAAAFITDIGGITSHVAIIARELRKPCIIGTKIATKVLKDGDLIEVDAEKGVVKILKK